MKRTHIAGLGCVLIVLAIAVAGLLHRGAQDVPADLVLLHDGEQIELSLEDLQQTSFSGETVNGKGEHFTHDYEGVALYDLLADNGIAPEEVSEAEVRAADQYAATVTGEEICEQDRIYLAVTVHDNSPFTREISARCFCHSFTKRCICRDNSFNFFSF